MSPRVFRVPAKYAAEIEAALVAAVDAIERDQREPGQHVAPFMLDPKREGEAVVVLMAPATASPMQSQEPSQPQAQVA